MIKIWYIVILASVLLGSCQAVNPPEDTVTFLNVQPFQVLDSSTKKSYAQVSTVFAFANNNPIGTFTLPANIPVIASNDVEIRLAPGITRNGTKAYQSLYIPYYNYVFSLKPNNGAQVVINPVTGFRTSIKPSNFLFEEDFESSSQFVHLIGDTCFKPTLINNCADCGKSIGTFTLDANHTNEVIVSTKPITLAKQDTYLELNYRNTVDFKVGLTLFDDANNPTEYYIVGYKPKSGFNKTYIPLSEVLQSYPKTARYLILLKTELPNGVANGTVEIDNIRVLTF